MCFQKQNCIILIDFFHLISYAINSASSSATTIDWLYSYQLRATYMERIYCHVTFRSNSKLSYEEKFAHNNTLLDKKKSRDCESVQYKSFSYYFTITLITFSSWFDHHMPLFSPRNVYFLQPFSFLKFFIFKQDLESFNKRKKICFIEIEWVLVVVKLLLFKRKTKILSSVLCG